MVARMLFWLVLSVPVSAQAAQVCIDLPTARILEAQQYAAPELTPEQYVKEAIKARVIRDLENKQAEADALATELANKATRDTVEGEFNQ